MQLATFSMSFSTYLPADLSSPALIPSPPAPLPALKTLSFFVHRNISSAGYDARKKLRECRGLVNALIHTLQMAHDEIINCKPVENVVCTLRNLSYRIQEMDDPDFYKKRSLPRGTTGSNKGMGIVKLKYDFYLNVGDTRLCDIIV